jgi:hypothetical protein
MYLTPEEMPMSFSGRGLFWAANSNLLNPPNVYQGYAQIFLGKPLRFIARLVYQIAIVIVGPFGLLYHLAMALINKVRSISAEDDENKLKFNLLAFEHLKASLHDLEVTVSLGARTPFCIEPIRSVSHFLSSSLVQSVALNDGLLSRLTLPAKIGANHPNHVAQMKQGLYRFDELVHRVLSARDTEGEPFDFHSDLGHAYCFLSSAYGTYGVESFS